MSLLDDAADQYKNDVKEARRRAQEVESGEKGSAPNNSTTAPPRDGEEQERPVDNLE